MRLDKLLSHLNCGSRKEVQALIRAGRVSVDGTVQKDPAFKVDPDRSQTAVDGTVQRYRAQRYYMLNKPMGVITASRDERHDTVLELFPAELRRGLFAVGRLDKDSQGLLLLTNDGDLSNAIQKSVNNHEKEYRVRVNREITEDFIRKMSEGVPILDTVTKKCKVRKIDDRSFMIVLTQGLNRQIRRMCDALGYRVVNLKRVRVCNVKLGNMRPGELRELSREEEAELRRIVGM
mgnify:CR=1 FL=1